MSYFDLIRHVHETCSSFMINTTVYNNLPTPLSLDARKICAEFIEKFFICKNEETLILYLTQTWDINGGEGNVAVEDIYTAQLFLNQIKSKLDEVIQNNGMDHDSNYALLQESHLIELASNNRPVEFVREIREMVRSEVNWLNENVMNLQGLATPTELPISRTESMDVGGTQNGFGHTTSSHQLGTVNSTRTNSNILDISSSMSSSLTVSQPILNQPQVEYTNQSMYYTGPRLHPPFSDIHPKSPSSNGSPSYPSLEQSFVHSPTMNTNDNLSPAKQLLEVPTARVAPQPPIPAINITYPTRSPFLSEVISEPQPSQALPSVVPNLDTLSKKLEALSSRIESQTKTIVTYIKERSMGNQGYEPLSNQSLQSEIVSVASNIEISDNLFNKVIHLLRTKNIKSLWNYQKQCKAIRMPVPEPVLTLEEISPPCQKLSSSFHTILQNLKSLNDNLPRGLGNIPLNQLFVQTFNNFKTFLGQVFLVKNQPNIIISAGTFLSKSRISSGHKTNLKPISACLLSSSNLTCTTNKKQMVGISLINEAHAKELFSKGLDSMNKMIKDGKAGVLGRFYNGTSSLNVIKNLPVVEFDGAKLESRTGKEAQGQNNVNVMEQKYCILFTLNLELFGEAFTIWTTSLPVCVSTHGSQKGLGMAVIIRDYLTSSMERIPFEIPHPETISWSELSKVIEILFQKDLEDGDLKLSEENLTCIKNKVKYAVRKTSKVQTSCSFSEEQINWSALSTKAFSHGGSGKDFTFWDWLLGSFETLRLKNMIEMWKEDLIMGFVDKQTAETKLVNECGVVGTFLLRFSDTSPGSISIVVLKQDGNAHHLNPFSRDEIKGKCLANLIKEKESKHCLEYIYKSGLPPKNQLLGKYYQDLRIPGYE